MSCARVHAWGVAALSASYPRGSDCVMGYGVGSMHSTCHSTYTLKHVGIPLDEQRSFEIGPSVADKSCYADLAREDRP